MCTIIGCHTVLCALIENLIDCTVQVLIVLCAQVYGFDVMYDSDCKAWLIEVRFNCHRLVARAVG